MYVDFVKKIILDLMKQEYSILNTNGAKDTVNSDTKLILMNKNESPILYLIAIINQQSLNIREYKATMDTYLTKLEDKLDEYMCNHIVCLNVVYMCKENEDIEQIMNTPFETGEKINAVWWTVNSITKELKVQKKGPTNIQKFSQVVISAIHEGSEPERPIEFTLKEIEESNTKRLKEAIINYKIHITYCLIIVNIVIWLYAKFIGDFSHIKFIMASGKVKVLTDGQYYRLVSSMFMHSDLMHLLSNSLSLYIYGSRLEQYVKRLDFLLIYFLSGIFASLFSALIDPSMSIGASGAVFGLLGGVVAYTKQKGISLGGLSFFTLGACSIVMIGVGFMEENVNNVGHISGFLAGISLQYILLKLKAKKVSDAD